MSWFWISGFLVVWIIMTVAMYVDPCESKDFGTAVGAIAVVFSLMSWVGVLFALSFLFTSVKDRIEWMMMQES